MGKVVWSFSLTEEELAIYDTSTQARLMSELSDNVEQVMEKYFSWFRGNGGK